MMDIPNVCVVVYFFMYDFDYLKNRICAYLDNAYTSGREIFTILTFIIIGVIVSRFFSISVQ